MRTAVCSATRITLFTASSTKHIKLNTFLAPSATTKVLYSYLILARQYRTLSSQKYIIGTRINNFYNTHTHTHTHTHKTWAFSSKRDTQNEGGRRPDGVYILATWTTKCTNYAVLSTTVHNVSHEYTVHSVDSMPVRYVCQADSTTGKHI